MGRYLFLENKELINKINLCPLSLILNYKLYGIENILSDIFKNIDGQINQDENDKNKYEQQFYKLYIDNRLLNQIIYIIYISMTYKYCISYINNFDDLINIDIIKQIFTYGEINKKMQGTQISDLLITYKENINKYIKTVSEYLNVKQHRLYIRDLLHNVQ